MTRKTPIPQKLPDPTLNWKVRKRHGCATKMANSKSKMIQGNRKAVSKEKNFPTQAAGLHSDSVNFTNPGQDYTETGVKTTPILGAYLLQLLLGTHSEGSSTQWQSKLPDDASG